MKVKFFFGSLLLIVISASALPQNNQKGYSDFNNILSHNTIMLSFDYSTNTNFQGNMNTGIRQPSFSPSIAYTGIHGLDLMAVGNFTNHSDNSLEGFSSELDFMAGYNLTLIKDLTVYPSYSRFIYSKNASVFNRIFENDFCLDAIYAPDKLNFDLSAGFFTGRKNTFYSSFSGSYIFDRFLPRQISIAFQPGFDINFGNYEYLNLVYLDEIRQDPSFYTYLLANSPALRKYVFKEVMNNPGTTDTEVIDRILEKQAEDNFALTSVIIGLPVYGMIKKMGFNLGLYVFIPVNQPEYLSGKAIFYFNAGLSYNFSF